MLNVATGQLAEAYFIAKASIIDQGYAPEIDWQYTVSVSQLDEQTFLREAAWVILSSGMRETVVRHKFKFISEAFLNWESALAITKHSKTCKKQALRHFNHIGKIDAILTVVSSVVQNGFRDLTNRIKEDGVNFLQQFPYIGPITCFHLAKNIGLPLAKPDRHLSRLVHKLGYDSAQHLCGEIADVTGEPIPVVDLVLWRYSTLHKNGILQLICND